MIESINDRVYNHKVTIDPTDRVCSNSVYNDESILLKSITIHSTYA